ncbi:NACHT, LRR and PYD domains-containing protein 3-like [Sardina pilchardus]|uniref:NACHT, LRR and PYD domains-containing protein 3-like n=1 Tax=Sardina pilchardus TaxID=27697 RepID=UPI002E158065
MSVSQEREEAADDVDTLRPESAAHSCGTMKNAKDMDDHGQPIHFNGGPNTHRPPSPVPSCVSLKSEESMPVPQNFSHEPPDHDRSEPRVAARCGVCEQVLRDPVITTCGHSFCRQCISSYWEQPGLPGDQACPQCGETCRTQPPLQPTLDEHTDMSTQDAGLIESSTHLHTGHTLGRKRHQGVIEKHKASLRRRFENISEGVNNPRTQVTLKKIYTEVYITEGESEGVNNEHEIWQVEFASRAQTTEDTPINCNDIFKPLPGQEKHIRTVMTKGVAGIGKTVSVQKFILDWTDGANQDIDFIFSFSFRELNLIRGDKYSLHSLLLDFYPQLNRLNDYEGYKDCPIVFIFDGLDESRLSLNFQPKMFVSDIKQASSVDVLITSLIQGSLLPSSLIWITSRPAAASQIPAKYIDQVTEVRGFNDPQKEEYFRKRISDESQANCIISHIKTSKSLHIMCHIPVFCWIAATVLQQMLEKDKTQEIPKTLTEMFIHFLLIQTTKKDPKCQSERQTYKDLLESQKEVILNLAKLAFKNLENGNVMFYGKDLIECGIDVSEASVYSGMCTEIVKEESVIHQKKVYCFVHLSIQEFLAALHIFVSYKYQMETMGMFFCLEDSLKFVVTKVLESRNGHLDLFLRFLMGISVESNQILLKDILSHTLNSSETIREMCKYIKDLNSQDLSPERCINLFHCLLEMNDHSLHKEIQRFLKTPNSFKQKLSPAHCSALAHMLLMSEEELDVFDLKRYNTSDEGRRRLIPALICFRTAMLDRCKLNQMSCETVRRYLQSANSLIQLDLSCNALGDSGLQIISAGLTSPHCTLKTLRLGDCKLSGESCNTLACVLQSANPLMELDLSHNDLGDSGIQHLCEGLASTCCKLQILRLSGCLISEKGCGFLGSALISNQSSLKELDLNYNHPGESGLKLLSARLEDSHCKLETLNMDHCAESRFRPGVQKYACELTMDPNTAGRGVLLSEQNRKVTRMSESQPYPDHPERFDWWLQVLCREGLSGRCYWEAEWSGDKCEIAVAYKSIKRKGLTDECNLGANAKSWALNCSADKHVVRHSGQPVNVSSSHSNRIGVYLDWLAGTLSFYSVSDSLTHLHTFHSTFTEPLYPGFAVWPNTSVSLCQIT